MFYDVPTGFKFSVKLSGLNFWSWIPLAEAFAFRPYPWFLNKLLLFRLPRWPPSVLVLVYAFAVNDSKAPPCFCTVWASWFWAWCISWFSMSNLFLSSGVF